MPRDRKRSISCDGNECDKMNSPMPDEEANLCEAGEREILRDRKAFTNGIEQRFWDERQCLSKDFIQIKYTPDCSDAMDNLHSLSCPTQAYMYTMGRVFRKTPQQTDGFRPERPQLGCEASNGRSGGPGIIWALQKASKGCLAGETIQRMVVSD
ncbi:uncharacterized protein PGTG_22395 [Puccinia graminis f. sp. tritici CRL 75-36-700-3]|uniref:Uncharacterized protein n=1 Tax=Puccinia graminis f. sp. tritici (strain CRL 75-36-700-3 / race SCCL) TaxID=418459 RepID=H6QUE4_PUCGT|nr:uncharacterized protein PGTG_22395 [Puccinia graminis f. sp. tritici CRL 75-36-700-3]EHS64607.1 hypothetical protein PGTG_22395 [Puccinia graminis f. sp. tritici CRL 75-36-700-3]